MRFEGTSAYVATDDLKVAVNGAITLERPLLVKGEPGTGKTVLALEIAKSLSAPLIEWHGGQRRTCSFTRWRSAASMSSSTYGVMSGSMDVQSDMSGPQMVKAIEQQAPAARDARHDGAHGNRQHAGDFGIRKLFHVA